MDIRNAGYEIITLTSFQEMERHIERCGRVCYKSEDAITAESTARFIRSIIDNGHESVIEHCSFTVIFTVDRGVTHEDVRHRLASFSQESTRYCNYSQGKFNSSIQVISILPGMNLDPKMAKLPAQVKLDIYDEWCAAMLDAERHYMKLIEMGATPQIARSVLPNATKATLVMTANIREWRHIFRLRTAKAAHPQMREVMIPLLLELSVRSPLLFADIEVEQ